MRPTRDLTATAGGAVCFNTALGIAMVALPLLALRSGYSATVVGLLTAAPAASQMLTRIFLGAVLRHHAEWRVILAGGVLLAVSCVLPAVSAAPVPFVAAELCQGAARGCFWTGSQTHLARGGGSFVKRLAAVNVIASAGLLAGPALAGVLVERSIALAFFLGAAVAAVGVLAALPLDRFAPYTRPPGHPKARLWSRRGIDAGCSAAVSSGGWRGLVSSYVPVALAGAHQPASVIGVLVSVANAASVGGAALVSRLPGRRFLAAVAVGTLAAGAGMALLALLAFSAPLAAAVLALSGLGAGALQTLGPALVKDAVEDEETGKALAAAGAFRSGALLGSPLAVSGMLAGMALPPAMAITGGLIALPALRLHRRYRTAATEAR